MLSYITQRLLTTYALLLQPVRNGLNPTHPPLPYLTRTPGNVISYLLTHSSLIVGRDKLLRTLQYFSRFYAWYLLRTNSPVRFIAPWEAIKKHFGLSRKLLRVGKNVEHFKAAAVAADSKTMDPILKYCAVGRQLGYAMYLSFDMITYVRQLHVLLFYRHGADLKPR